LTGWSVFPGTAGFDRLVCNARLGAELYDNCVDIVAIATEPGKPARRSDAAHEDNKNRQPSATAAPVRLSCCDQSVIAKTSLRLRKVLEQDRNGKR
jgi:hypothetical protein